MRISDWSSDVCSSDLFDLVPASTFDDGNKGLSDWSLRTLSGSGQPWILVPGLLGDDADYIHWGLDNGTAADTVMESPALVVGNDDRSEEHTSELQSLMRISYAVFCLKKKKNI